jgi:uncharacterized protein YcbK (DUF882 family)
MSKWEHFTDAELKCKCGKCETKMNDKFMNKLEAMRAVAKFPFKLSSAYRCPMYNDIVSTSGRAGPHTTGRAVDILCSGEQAYWIVAHANYFGMTGIGIKQKGAHESRFIHLDDLDKGTRPWVWSY